MMDYEREIKFNFLYHNEETNKWLDANYTLDDLIGKLAHLVGFSGCNLVAKRLYTGLKYENGEEVYEGDVQKLQFDSHYWIYVVGVIGGNFGDQLFSMAIRDNLSSDEDGNWTFKKRDLDGDHRSYVRSGKGVTLLGNVYQNPELLKP